MAQGARFLAVVLLLLAGCGDDGATAVASSAREEDHFIQTADGWTLALHRYVPAETKYVEPVLLTHGFIENRRVWDLDDEHSIARRLVEQGFEVWTMDLRGSGASEKTNWAFDIDDFVDYDAPATIEYILATTGAPQILMGGHSMGGLVTYAMLEGPLAPKVKAAVTLAGAGTMSGGLELKLMLVNFFAIAGLALGPILPDDLPFPFRTALQLLLGENDAAWAAIGKLMDSLLGRPFWYEGNMTPELVTLLLRVGCADTSMNVVKQFGSYAASGKVAGITDNLWRITAPVLAIAGAEDLVIPASNVKTVAQKCGAKFVEIPGVGHEDICVGEKSPALVYPLVVEWMASHATPW